MSDAFFKFYGRDFRDGVRGLKADVVGVYIVVLTLIYDMGGAVPDDETWIAPKIGFDVRVWKRCRAELIKAGKLKARNGVLTNKKADTVLAERGRISEARAEAGQVGGEASGRSRRAHSKKDTSREDRANFSETSPRSSKEVFEKPPPKSLKSGDNSEASASNQKAEPEYSSTADKSAAELAPAPPNSRPLDRCFAVAGPGLADPAKHPTLHLSAHRIAAAMTAGCDLDLDILPVIAARTAQPRASPITTWSYFDRAWADARDARTAQFTPPDPTRFAGATHVEPHRPHRQRRNTGSLVDAAVRLIDRTGAAHRIEPDDELGEGEIVAPRRIGAG